MNKTQLLQYIETLFTKNEQELCNKIKGLLDGTVSNDTIIDYSDIKSKIADIMKNNWSYTKDQVDAILNNYTELPIDEYIEILTDDLIENNESEHECFTIKQTPFDFSKPYKVHVITPPKAKNRLESIKIFLKENKSKYHIPTFHELTYITDKENYDSIPQELKDTSKYFYAVGAFFRARSGHSMVPIVNPYSSSLDPAANDLGRSVASNDHFFVLENL